MELQLLKVNEGDAIHLRVTDEKGVFRNILIDGGTKNAYVFKDKNKKTQDGELKQLIRRIQKRNEQIDLLIMTHVDDDHIGGILQWFADRKEKAENVVKQVWFNSGRLIFQHFNKRPIADNNLVFIPKDESVMTGIKQGVVFENFIRDNQIWYKHLIKSGDVLHRFGLKFTILSPSEDKLKELLVKWEKEMPFFDTSRTTDYSIPLSQLMTSDPFKEDKSVHNGSSIAFLVEYQDTKLLFLGDALPKPIVDTLKRLGYTPQSPLQVNYVKLSHHGSKGNTNDDFLKLIQAENFLISTDSSVHGLPDKRCLARIIKNKQKANLYFNYPELSTDIFTDQDLMDFPQVSICRANEPIIL